MITKLRIDVELAAPAFGMRCQRFIPWSSSDREPPIGAMACFLDAGRASDPDCHDQDEVMMVLTGTGSVTLAGESTTIAAGDVIVLPRNREHVVRNTADARLSWVSIYWPLHEPQAEAAA